MRSQYALWIPLRRALSLEVMVFSWKSLWVRKSSFPGTELIYYILVILQNYLYTVLRNDVRTNKLSEAVVAYLHMEKDISNIQMVYVVN
jgi:hypothetical protein